MAIPIPIPIGRHYITTVQGVVWKFVNCEQCREPYAYLLELQARGDDHDLLFLDGKGSADRARERALQNLEKQGQNRLLPIPCPNCGHYQDDMARQLKEENWINRPQMAGMALLLISFVVLVIDVATWWPLALALATPGMGLIIYGYVLLNRFDPDAGNAAARKAIGQKYAAWGERLAELRAAYQGSESAQQIAGPEIRPPPGSPLP